MKKKKVKKRPKGWGAEKIWGQELQKKGTDSPKQTR